MFFRILVFLFFSITCLAQQAQWQSISIANGLSQGMVYDLMQDHQGFIWVATKDGLNRYDGYNFKVFTHNPYKAYSISGNTCTALLEDSQGRIWVSTEKDGLNLYNSHSQRFYNAKLTSDNKESSYIVFNIKEDTAGNIWLLTDNPDKVFVITQKGYPAKQDFSQWVSPARHTNIKQAQFKFDLNAPRLAFTKSFYAQNGFPDTPEEEYKVLQDYKNRYWVSGKDKIYCFDGKHKIKTISFPKWKISIINQFSDKSIVICNQQHIWIFNPDELLKIDKLTPENAFAPVPDVNIAIRQFIQDKSGNIWAGTYGYGLLKFNKNIRQFQSYLQTLSPSHLFEDRRGRVFIHGNYRPGHFLYEFNQAKNTIERIPVKMDTLFYSHDLMMQDKKGNFYLIHHTVDKRYLAYYSDTWQLLKQYEIPVIYAPINFNRINFSQKIYEDTNNLLWLGVNDGILLQFNPVTAQFKSFSYQHLLPESNSTVETFALYPDQQGTFWIGTQMGLIKAESLTTKPQYTIYKNSNANQQSLSNDFVSSIIEDPYQSQRYLWVSTKGGGLDRLDKQSGIFEHFTEEQGLPNKVVYGILADNNKNLWLSTNRGLSRFNPKTLTFTNFNKSDGLQDDEFNTNSYFKGPSGRLFFGGINGITIINPSALAENPQAPVVRIFGLKVNNKNIDPTTEGLALEKPIEYLNKLELAHNQNQISLEFGLMDFTNSVKNRYRYQLVGIDEDWVEAGTNHFANFAQLPSGRYTFKVTGTADGEIWSSPATLVVQINPPFYFSWWAYLIYISLFAYAAYRLYVNQLNKVRLQEQLLYKNKEAERLAELDSLKTRFFANISHEFRTPLTLLTGPLANFSKKYPNERMLDMMHRNLKRLQTLINQLLDLSKLEAEKMNPIIQQSDLPTFLKPLLASFDSLAQSKNISFIYEKAPKPYIAYFDADKLEKIVTNILSNAFKFTPDNGLVSVNTVYTDTHFSITIQDSGIGIEQERLPFIFDRFYQVEDSTSLKSYTRNYEGTGIGLALVKELVDVLKGKINVSSEVGTGTSFTVSIPTDKTTWEKFLSEKPLVVEVNNIENEDIKALNFYDYKVPTDSDTINPDSEQPILLIIEDNADLRAYIRAHFEHTYQIIEAVDGQEGYEKALTSIPDLVICDLMMPRLDGFSFCRLIKSDILTNHIPVIMLTARATLEDRLEGLEIGADDYLAKPFNTDELQIRVRNLIATRQVLQQKLKQTIENITLAANPKPVTPDERFLTRLHEIIDKNLINTEFDTNLLAKEIHMTPPQLRRKLKALCNENIVEFIRNYRLHKAAKLLENKSINVSDVAYEVGFDNLAYFSRAFYKKFGKNPSEWG